MDLLILDDIEENLSYDNKDKIKEWYEKSIMPIKDTIIQHENLNLLTEYLISLCREDK